jgi:hypothetical protein
MAKKADRIASEHWRQSQQAKQQTDAEAAARTAAHYAKLKRDISAEALAVLGLLEQHGYENTGMIPARVERARAGLKHGGLGYKTETVAAWDIGRYISGHLGETTSSPATYGTIYLLSSGKFLLADHFPGGWARDLNDLFLGQYLDLILNGLKQLRDHLNKQLRDRLNE